MDCVPLEGWNAYECVPSVPPIECDDGDPCNGVEVCATYTGKCMPGTPLDCDDGKKCNGVEGCLAGVGCVPGVPPIDCDDDDDCTADWCADMTASLFQCHHKTPDDCPTNVVLGFGDLELDGDTALLDLVVEASTEVAGYQIDVTGIVVVGSAGGAASDNGLDPMIGVNGTRILGFSMVLDTIPAGTYVLARLRIVYPPDGDEACIAKATFSNLSPVASGVWSLKVETEPCYVF